ncbi:TonB-dependent receptor [uncultured Pseudoteredinibacter sp.]|uniref:TonB-dependent receptor n=1 Tax=uncultured Pseudoteredinibacter sp. TaxID=1641701 RepID=UPI0026146B00|nr:TonB-dependent receptor [uncultured Pseudoteredinibacter sp.]
MKNLFPKTLLASIIASQISIAHSAALEEIVVTATKRELGMQDVAIAISALSGESLENKGATDFESYARLLPGLSYVDAGSGKKKLTVRGLSDGTEFDAQLQATTSIYFNDIPLTSGVSAPDLHMTDIARVELLRGPQGTLYGAGSLGGTLRIITNEPVQGEFQGKIDGSYGATKSGDPATVVNMMMNIPLSDNLALRAVAYKKDDGGFIDYTHARVNEEDANDISTKGGRLALAYEPNDQLKINASYIYQESDINGKAWFNPGSDLSIDAPVKDEQLDSTKIYNFTVDYDFGDIALYASSSYFNGDNDWVFEYSENAYLALKPIYDFSGIEAISPHHFNEEFDIFAQEIRLQSVDDSAFQWTAGLFYQKDKVDHEQIVVVDNLAGLLDVLGLLQPGISGALVAPGGPFYVGDEVVYRNQNDFQIEQKAIFGEASYAFNDQWSATIGLRAFETEISDAGSSRGIQNLLTGRVGTPPGISTGSVSSSEDSVNPKFEVSFRPDDDRMIYALASKGYRIGGANSDIAVAGGAPAQYKSDSLWNYELGFKTQWMGNQLRLNGAIYYLDWSDIQTKSLLSNGFGYIDNAGSASITGFELEGAWQIDDIWSVDFGFDIKEAQLEEDYISAGTQQGADGDRLQGVPEFSYNFAINFDKDIADDMALRGLLAYQYVDESFMEYEFVAGPQHRIGDYAVLSANINLLLGDNIEVGLFGKNLTDERARTTAINVVDERVFTIRPRTIGMNFKYQF